MALAKLRKHFLDDLEVEHIVLHAFRYCPLDHRMSMRVAMIGAAAFNWQDALILMHTAYGKHHA